MGGQKSEEQEKAKTNTQGLGLHLSAWVKTRSRRKKGREGGEAEGCRKPTNGWTSMRMSVLLIKMVSLP